MNTGARTNSACCRRRRGIRQTTSERHRTRATWADDYKKRPDMTWRDHLLMLLSFGATVEHCLMVQYLYAAYSLRTDIADKRRRKLVESWRAGILAVAKEEMGHLLTVQNSAAAARLDGRNRPRLLAVGARVLSLSIHARAVLADVAELFCLCRDAVVEAWILIFPNTIAMSSRRDLAEIAEAFRLQFPGRCAPRRKIVRGNHRLDFQRATSRTRCSTN